MKETSDQYSVKLIINRFEDTSSRWKVHLIVHVALYESSRFTYHTEELSIECNSNDQGKQSLKFSGPNLVGFDLGC
jgi:hypothetical protein